MIWFIAVGSVVVWYSGFYCGCLEWLLTRGGLGLLCFELRFCRLLY